MSLTSAARAAALSTLAAGVVLIAPRVVQAAPEEIQVYLDDMSAAGHAGLDVHTNFTPVADDVLDYPGQQASRDRLRVTPEFAYGLTTYLEAGLYLPLATVDGGGRVGADGAKIRLKFIAPKAEGQTWFWGANFEIGRVDRRLDINPWNAELKGILGRRLGPWTVAFNSNIDFKVSGPAPAPATLEIDTQITYELAKDLSVGVETYNGVGELRRLGRFAGSEQSTYLVVNKSFGRWDVNFGVGAGYGASTDALVLKAIVGVPID